MTTLVNFKLAKLLKQKDFPLKNTGYGYTEHGNVVDLCFENVICEAPTIAEAVTWLYDTHKIWIWVEQENNSNEFEWLCRYERKGSCKDYDDKFYNSPTEAYECAIEYCLISLV